MKDMERFADGVLSHMLEENCNAPPRAENKTETEDNSLSTLRSLAMRPRFDLQETSEGVVLTAFTPGLRKEELSIEVVDNENTPYLVIAGESNHTLSKSDADEGSTIAGTKIPYRASYARFERRIRIPHNVDRSSVKADYQDGMLTVTMSRKALPAPHKQRVLIQ
jgi:HSP20 family protein